MDGYNCTDGTRLALQAAGDAAARRGHEYIGTEHLLLGLLHHRESTAAKILTNLGADFDGLVAQIDGVVKGGEPDTSVPAELPYTSRVKKVLELAMASAGERGASIVGTQHILLGLQREEMGVAAQVLAHSGITPAQVTREMDARSA